MTGFPGSPRLVKGGLVLIDPQTAAVQRVIALQYNPDTLTRSLKIKGVDADSGDHIDALRLKGPPEETFKVEAELDLTDQQEAGDSQAVQNGLHPVLASLEVIVYPSSAHLLSTNDMASNGILEIVPFQTPLTVFVFGPNRIVPVRITELSITEEAFDTSLNPIRAKVSLGMRVLSVDDLGFNQTGGNMFIAYLQQKERMQQRATAGSLTVLGVRSLP
jgi:hypothetical protein